MLTLLIALLLGLGAFFTSALFFGLIESILPGVVILGVAYFLMAKRISKSAFWRRSLISVRPTSSERFERFLI